MGLIDVSIDPGTNATGYCFWRDGRVIDIGTIRPKATVFVDKAIEIHWRLVEYMADIQGSGLEQNVIYRFAVEDFEFKHAEKAKKMSREAEKVGMTKCGAIQGICVAAGLRFTGRIMLISKGTISKTQTAMLAKAYGLKGSKDALDAFQIGVCAGFDKK